MISVGSKGNEHNLTQIMGLLGQQEIEGTWIKEQLYRRVLPHFHKNNLSPEAHGFVEHSFIAGLSPIEYWYHAQAGRMGIISTAIKTAETGYIQRKLIKALEDLRVCYDGTVRNAQNIIIQTVYGNNGFDSCFQENQKLKYLKYSRVRLYNEFMSNINYVKKNITEEKFNIFSKRKDIDKMFAEEFIEIQ